MTTIATFTSTPERPVFWPATRSLEECSCPHGAWAAYSGLQNLPGPGASPSAALENLHRTTGCSCQFAPPTHQAAVTLQAYPGVPRDTTIALVQVAVPPAAPFDLDSLGRLSVSVDALVSVTATFTLLARDAGGIGALRLPDASQSNLEGPSVVTAGMVDDNGAATCTLSYTAPVAAGTSFEVDYWNGTGVYQDLTGGTLLVVLP